MKDRRNIDDLFQERFEQFEATPPADMWDRIESRMKQEDDDRKVIPIWWRYAGVAALIALLLTTGTFVFDGEGADGSDQLVDTNTTEQLDPEQNLVNNELVDSNGNLLNDVTGDLDTNVDSGKTNTETEDPIDRSREVIIEPKTSNEGVAVENSKGSEGLEVQERDAKIMGAEEITTVQTENAVAVEENKNATKEKTNTQNYDPRIDTNKEVSPANTQEAVGIKNDTKSPFDSQPANMENQTVDGIDTDQKATDPRIDTNTSLKETSTVAVEKQKEEVEGPVEEAEVEENKKSIFEAIAEEEAVAATTPEEKPDRSWEITPNVGPVYYDGFGNGSAIDPVFADNGQSGNVNLTYGVQVAYNLNDRLSVRSGVNNVDLGYTTDGVEIAEAPVGVALKSVDYGGRSIVLTAFDKGTLNNRPNSGQGDPLANATLKSSGGEAQLVQDLSYYEIPLEVNYALLNNRFGIHMIGGFSTLVLGNNEISVRDGAINEIIGEANNLNSVSFTTNVGLGFNYKFSNRLKFNIEPMFKYQLNPYSDSSVDFNPYYMGVYSGLSFKF